MKIEKKLRLRGKCLFLTYPAKDIENKEDIQDMLLKELENSLEWYIIAFEKGGAVYNNDDEEIIESKDYDHYHIYVSLKKGIDTEKVDKFDIIYKDKKVHGNYQTVKYKSKAIKYITKGNDWQVFPTDKANDILANVLKVKVVNIVNKEYIKEAKGNKIRQKILEAIQGNQDGLEELIDHMEFLYNKKNKTMEEAALLLEYFENRSKIDKVHNEMIKAFRPVADKVTYYMKRSWMIALYLWFKLKNKHNNVFSLFIQGPPGCYKTSALQHLFGEDSILDVQHKDECKIFNKKKHVAVLLDDIDPGKKRDTFIKLTDSEKAVQMDVKGSMVRLPKSHPRILTSNENVSKITKNDRAIARRMFKIQLTKMEKEDSKYYSDVFGNGLLVYIGTIEHKESIFYEAIMDISEGPVMLWDKKDYELYGDKGISYMPVETGFLKEKLANKDFDWLHLISGDRFKKHKKELQIAMSIYKLQKESYSIKVDRKKLEEVIQEFVVAKCICKYNINKEEDLDDQLYTCFYCKYVEKYSNDSKNTWYKFWKKKK